MKDYDAGKPGEDFYEHIVAPVDFHGQTLEDLRGRCIEGDFAVGEMNKYIVEVKSDHVCFRNQRPTGNLPIEIKNTANSDGEGWFTHCKADNVAEIVFVCFDGDESGEPVCSIRIPFDLLEPYVTAKLKDDSYRQEHYRKAYSRDGKPAYNLCVPLKELYKHCGATIATARTESPELRRYAQAALEAMGIDGTLGKYGHISFSEDERIGALPPQHGKT